MYKSTISNGFLYRKDKERQEDEFCVVYYYNFCGVYSETLAHLEVPLNKYF